MKLIRDCILSFLVVALVSVARADEPIRIALAGDSTVCDYNPERTGSRGWGMYLAEQFRKGTVEVKNFAISGRSTKTFIKHGDWTRTLAWKPDYIMIQFGHNDSHPPANEEATDSKKDYRANLIGFIRETREQGAEPILVTPMVRRNFNEEGKILEVDGPEGRGLDTYSEAMKTVAKEMEVPVIDLYRLSRELMEQVGPDQAATLANKAGDVTHFNEAGARVMANLVMEEVRQKVPELARRIAGSTKQP